ncbi:MAG: response regulator transcription factor [Candidatus Sumerlaeaceae bacterium]
MPESPGTSARVLIVDDNRIYREAFRRNLLLQNYAVEEAEDTQEALQKVNETTPDVVITDLQMRTETEGLELIKSIKTSSPLTPIIMISAVGTFEEGALAQRYGASAVLSKSRIEDEIDRLYQAIDTCRAELERNRVYDSVVQRARTLLSDENADPKTSVEELRSLLAQPEMHPYLRREAFDLYDQINERAGQEEARKQAEALANKSTESRPDAQATAAEPKNLEAVETELRREIPAYDTFTEDSKESLRIAEFLYDQQQKIPGSIDFSRNVGFSYCFAVENEVKARMAKRLQRFLAHEQTSMLVMEMMENNNQSLSVFYHQHLLLLLRGREMDFTIDNVKQTLRRILEHQSRYKPDGLKALGIMIIAFGRTYQWQKQARTVKVHNPLGLKGLDTEAEVIRFAELLVSLQHFRNPYIHPEISDLQKLSIIRQAAIECLNMASKLQ